MIYRFTFFLVFLSSLVQAQQGNLVENPSFDFRPECDDNNGPPEEAPPWFNPTGATPDVFHECAVQLEDPCPYPENVFLDPWLFGVPTNGLGCQEPKIGGGYAGVYFMAPGVSPDFDYREYLGIPLSESLISGQEYLVRFYISLAERSSRAVYAFQVLFSSDSISVPNTTNFLNLQPQLTYTEDDFITDKENWTEISWEYVADGSEEYMYIGNFQSNAVIDTIYVLPDSIDQEDHVAAYYYIDDVYIGTEGLGINDALDSFNFAIWPNPVDDRLNLRTDKTVEETTIYSIDGKLIYNYNQKWSGELHLNTADFSSGCYLINLVGERGCRTSKKFVKR
jgi:hypothetical protein